MVLNDLKVANFDQQLGVSIIKSAITRPSRTIVENAGEEGSVVVGNLLEKYATQFNMGYDASTGEYCDMIEKGILDPLKVVSSACLIMPVSATHLAF